MQKRGRMRAAQSGFDFDPFDMAGFTVPSFEDFEGARKRREAREREQRERSERARREQQEREQRSRARHTCYENPWDVLGVRPGCSGREIRAAWVRLCKQHHPDAGGNVEEMKRVNKAYESLKGQMK